MMINVCNVCSSKLWYKLNTEISQIKNVNDQLHMHQKQTQKTHIKTFAEEEEEEKTTRIKR